MPNPVHQWSVVSKHDSDQPGLQIKWRRRANRVESIKNRVVRVALIPSVALILLWVVAAAYLGGTGFYDQQVASSVRVVSIPAVTGLASIEKERQLSMAYLAAPSVALQPLLAQQKQSDQGLSALQAVAGGALGQAPGPIKTQFATLTGFINQLPNIRGRIDAGVASRDEVFTFYGDLLDAATGLFAIQARVVPDASAIPGAVAAANVFHISDLMSRASSVISGAIASGSLDQANYLQFTSLVGAYHALLSTTEQDLRPPVQASYQQLIKSASWQQLVATENELTEHGTWAHGVPSDLGITAASWQNLTNSVFSALTSITLAQADQVSQQALNDGNNQLLQLAIALVIALLVVIGSIWWARRQSSVLVDNALVTRLGKLRADALDLVGSRLPDMIRRLRAGEPVDTEAQLARPHDEEGDEIDQVATAIRSALRAAVSAAAGEAQARNALNTVFRGIARRNQLPLYNLLSLLDTLEQAEQDSAALERLYRLDHEATRARRNSENLIILSGGDLGQHLPGPVRMRDVLRSAISETHEYQRVKLKGSVPDVGVSSDAATGLIHLIAELLENAARFSPPGYEVLIRSMPAKAGMIVEVEDRGLGMPDELKERVNTMLAEPPEVDVMAIGDGSQLGFWVIASLVKRFGFKVALRESDYGGVLAIVRVPNQHVVVDPNADLDTERRNGARERLPESGARMLRGGHRARHRVPERESTASLPRITAPAVATIDDDAIDSPLRLRLPTGSSDWAEQGTAVSPSAEASTAAQRTQRWQLHPVPQPPAQPDNAAPATAETVETSASGGEFDQFGPARRPGAERGSELVEEAHAWPTAEMPEEQATAEQREVRTIVRRPLPQRSPGDHLNPRLAHDSDGGEPGVFDDDDANAAGREIGAGLSAFQQGSEAGRLADDS
jgi:signal transduction histidine kinase